MTPFLKTLLFVNVLIALAYALFYGAVLLCFHFGISPWWAGAVYLALYAAFLWRECRTVQRARRFG